MVKLIHHETPINKAFHYRKIEILAVVTLFVGSLSFLFYSYCSHNADNPLCRCLLCTLNRTPEDGEYLYNKYLVVISIAWAALLFGALFVILYYIERKDKTKKKKRIYRYHCIFSRIVYYALGTCIDDFNGALDGPGDNSKVRVEMRPMTRHALLVTFMELTLILWTNYMVLLFCYDDHIIGDRHPITALVAFGCLIGSLFMFRRLVHISQWSYAIRFAIATVVVFRTFVEVMERWNAFREIWMQPMAYKSEMITLLAAFIVLVAFLWYKSIKNKK